MSDHVTAEEKERRLREMDKTILKEALKESLREWLDEKYAEFGKWSVHGLMAAALGATVYLIIWSQWHK